jgi:hypothetical protein
MIYYPDNTDNDKILYKWAYTNSWIGKWYSDAYWNYLWWYDSNDSPMTIYHPVNHTGKYKLGIAIYFNDSKYIRLYSY